MTFKELLDSTSFEEIEPFLHQYPEAERCLHWYQLHYDMLRSLQPKVDNDANAPDCTISMEKDECDPEPYLDAHPMEGGPWEHSLTKELKVAPDVTASWPEIAACCLWHTSFYGFIPQHVHETFEEWSIDKDWYHLSKDKARKYAHIIRAAGGSVPSIRQLNPTKKEELIRKAKKDVWHGRKPQNRMKRMKNFRREFMEQYYERFNAIAEFICDALPALNDSRNYMTAEQLCGLFGSTLFTSQTLPSYVADDMEMSGAKYLENVIQKYSPFPPVDRVVVHLITSERHEHLTDEEQSLINAIFNNNGISAVRLSGDLILSTDPTLGKQVLLKLALFNSENPLVL